MLHSAVALSIVLGFACTEFLGLMSGGMISSGYLAFYLEQPFRVASTLLLAIMVFALVKILSRYLILFGRRRFMLTVLLGIFLSVIVEKSFIFMTDINQDMRIIGYIIPGLIANDMVKQGVFKTLIMVMLVSALIWMAMHAGLLG